MSDDKLVTTYLQTKSISAAAKLLGVKTPKVANRLTYLRKRGVALPRFGYNTLKDEDVERLNTLVKENNYL